MGLRRADVHIASWAGGSETAGERPSHLSLGIIPVTEVEFSCYLQTPHIIKLPVGPPDTWG